MASLDTYDDFPREGRSPRLHADVDSIPHAQAIAEIAGHRWSVAKLRRLRLMAIIVACRNAPVPVPYSTLIETLGISRACAARLYKLGSARMLRRARV